MGVDIIEREYCPQSEAADLAWIMGTDYKIDTSALKMDLTKIQLTIIGLIIAFGLNHS